MTKEDAPAEIEVADAPAPTVAEEEEEEAADIEIERGYLQKKGSNPLNPWNKRYFAFGNDPIDINNLQALHKRNERRVKATPAPAPAPAEGEAAEGTEVAAAAAATPAPAPAKPTVSDVYEQANKDLLVNIAHATQTGKGLLFYHKSDDSSHVANPLGVINLRDVNSVERVEKSSKNRSFVVSTKNRDYHFSAGTSQEAKGWVKAIAEKSEEAKAAKDPYESPQFGEVYKQLGKGVQPQERKKTRVKEGEKVTDLLTAISSNERFLLLLPTVQLLARPLTMQRIQPALSMTTSRTVSPMISKSTARALPLSRSASPSLASPLWPPVTRRRRPMVSPPRSTLSSTRT